MKKSIWIAVVLALLLFAALRYGRRTRSELDVEPHAREEIEKARQR